jgi:hypothetical protein
MKRFPASSGAGIEKQNPGLPSLGKSAAESRATMKKPQTHVNLSMCGKTISVGVNHQQQPMITDAERRARILRGLQRLTNEARQLDREQAAAKAQTLVDEATRIVGTLTDVESAIAAPRENHVGKAAADAARVLVKSLPGIFANAGEAAGWAIGHLPLAEARRASGRDRIEKTRLEQQRHGLRQSFWRATGQAALLVARCSGTYDSGKCLDEAESVGRFI